MKLRPVSFSWKKKAIGDKVKLGFLAQDLQEVISEVVVDHDWVEDEKTNELKKNLRSI